MGDRPHFERLSYDFAGNRTSRVTESMTESYSYDSCNRLTQLQRSYTDLSKTSETLTYAYDSQGNMLSDGQNTYRYDSFNRVEQVTTAEGKVQTNHYDAEGLRHEMEENGELVKFLFNENREVEVEEESSGNIIRYIRGLGLICSDSESAKTYYHYASDEQGSITHVTDAETGEVLNHYTYDAFGNTMECSEQVHNRFRYNGEQYDQLTNQYYLRARFYNPVIARFTQEDTYYGDGLNLYQYCANNPIAYADPSGHNICQTQRDVYHAKCEEYMKEHGLTDYSQIPKNEKTRMFKEMRTELGKTSDSKYKGSGTSPEGTGTRLFTDPVTGQKYYYSDKDGYVFDLVSDYLQGNKQMIPGDPLMYSMKNKNGGTIVVSTDVIDLNSFINTLDFYNQQGRKIVILSGSHGMKTGESALGVNRKKDPNMDYNSRRCAEREFYNQDVGTAKAYNRVKVYDITEMSDRKFNKILNSRNVTICAWCFSERSNDVINAIK